MDKLNEVKGIPSYQNTNRIKNSFQVQFPKENKMSTKVLLKTVLPLSLLVVVFLAAPIVSGKSALAPAGESPITVQNEAVSFKIDPRSASPKLDNLAGSDWIERHPPVVASIANLVGSDYIERHPSSFFTGSDYIERHPSNFFAGSDWIERHPPVVASTANLAGSDYIERHPSNFYDGSDWIERHP